MIDTSILVTGIVGVFSTIVSSWITWFFTRKKYYSEVDNNLIQNMQKSLDFYRDLSNDNEERLKKILEDNAALRQSVNELLKENKQLKKEMDVLKDQVIKITTTICTDLSCQIRSKDFSTITNNNNEEAEFE